ncbi:hypothetical protein COU76_00885 [Candidatus Peregrinibacteria bacterium CG10_big_fil_rev_8_21_14_0_10_49_10]|nr:MAG: hypothetical protein COU76_00885 [Candidatus Peregrinibacteria bacterium CG10_big_fil_rev_8_21_14_0_10_49_10]
MMMLVVGINVSAQQISTLPIGRNAEFGIHSYSLLVASYEVGHVILKEKQVPFASAEVGDFESHIKAKLSDIFVQSPSAAGDNLDFFIVLQTDWMLGFDGRERENDAFKLEKTAEGWKIPNSAINFEFRTGAGGWYIPTASGFEVETTDGRILSLITGRNDFTDHGCDLLAIRSALEQQGWVVYPLPIGSREFPVKRLTIWEETKFVSLNGDGIPTEWSSPAPSFFQAPIPPVQPERRPLMVNIRLEGKGRLPVLVVSGDGSEGAVIEQSRNGLGNWGPAISLSQPPRLSSLNEGEYLYEFAEDQLSTGDTVVFYRARATSETQNN